MFVTAVCFLSLLKLKWPKNKNINDVITVARTQWLMCFFDRPAIIVESWLTPSGGLFELVPGLLKESLLPWVEFG